MQLHRFILIALFGAFSPCALAAEADWKIGLARVKITPEQPVFLSGYANRNKPYEKITADLYAKALALEDADGQKAVLVTTDLLGLPAAVAEPICERLGKKHGLRREQILFNSSHIHTGPALALDPAPRENRTAGDSQRTVAYTKQLQDKLVELVGAALERHDPAKLPWRAGVAHF